MPSLAAIFATVTLQFPRITAWARSFCSFVDVDGRPHLSASTTLVRLLLNTASHSYTLRCGKQFCPHLAANCRWVSAPFIPSGTKICTTARCLSLVQTSSEAVIFTPCSIGTNGQLNHTRSMSPSDLELQHDQALAVLPIIQRKYSIISLTFWISFVYSVQWGYQALHFYLSIVSETSLKFCPVAVLVTSNIWSKFLKIYLYTKLHMNIWNGSLVTVIKPTAIYIYLADAILLLYILQKNGVTNLDIFRTPITTQNFKTQLKWR
jgi:hypothetical protein